MGDNNGLIYPEIFSNEYVVNIENVRFTLITQYAPSYEKYTTPNNIIMHFHTCFELFLCEKGETFVLVDDSKITLKPGEMIIVSPKIFHAQAGGSPNQRGACLRFLVASNGLNTNFDLYKSISEIIGDSKTVIPVTDELIQTVFNIASSGEANEFYNVFKYVYSFLTQLLELGGKMPKASDEVFADNVELRTHKIRVFIHENINKPISLKEISECINMSTRHTSRIIRYKFGCSFKEYITGYRMKRAAELVLQNKHSVSEIASMVGYSSEKGFYTAFKKYHGCLPGEYRKYN